MPAKSATFDRPSLGLPPGACQDDARSNDDALPTHLNTYFMDLDEFFQATGTSCDNSQRYVTPSIQQSPLVSDFNANVTAINRIHTSPEVAAPSSNSGIALEPNQDTRPTGFPVFQQPVQDFLNGDADSGSCQMNEGSNGYCTLPCKTESEEGSLIELDLSKNANWSELSNASYCSTTTGFDAFGDCEKNSLESDDIASEEGTKKCTEGSSTSKQHKRRGGGKPGRKRKREYIYDPKPLQHKLSQTAVPEDLKNTDYWERRKRNNLAAKRSRENRRMKEMEVLNKCSLLEKENAQVRAAMRRLEMRNAWLEKAIAEYLKGMNKTTN